MLQYAVTIYPLITRLKDPSKHKQCWYADDSSCAGQLVRIKQGFLELLQIGSSYEYFAKPSKSVIVVKKQHLNEAKNQLADMEVMIHVCCSSKPLSGRMCWPQE